MSEVLHMIKYVINSRTRHFLFSCKTRTPSVQNPSVFAQWLLTAIWRLVLLPLCVTFPTTHTFLKNGLLCCEKYRRFFVVNFLFLFVFIITNTRVFFSDSFASVAIHFRCETESCKLLISSNTVTGDFSVIL